MLKICNEKNNKKISIDNLVHRNSFNDKIELIKKRSARFQENSRLARKMICQFCVNLMTVSLFCYWWNENILLNFYFWIWQRYNYDLYSLSFQTAKTFFAVSRYSIQLLSIKRLTNGGQYQWNIHSLPDTNNRPVGDSWYFGKRDGTPSVSWFPRSATLLLYFRSVSSQMRFRRTVECEGSEWEKDKKWRQKRRRMKRKKRKNERGTVGESEKERQVVVTLYPLRDLLVRHTGVILNNGPDHERPWPCYEFRVGSFQSKKKNNICLYINFRMLFHMYIRSNPMHLTSLLIYCSDTLHKSCQADGAHNRIKKFPQYFCKWEYFSEIILAQEVPSSDYSISYFSFSTMSFLNFLFASTLERQVVPIFHTISEFQ